VSVAHVVAVTARTPVGLTAESSAAAVRAGVSRVTEHPFLVDLRGDLVRAALDGRLDPDLLGVPRMCALGRSALSELARKLESAFPLFQRDLDVFVGLPEPRAGFSKHDARELVAALSRSGGLPDSARFSTSMAGHAAALDGLREAAAQIAAGRRDLCVVGGVDSYLEPDTLLQLDSRGQLAGEGVRSGFPPGEAACFVALASDRAVQTARLSSLARVREASSTREARVLGGNDVNRADGLTEALAHVGRALAETQEQVDDIYCDVNGERYRTEEWGFALLRTGELWRDPSVYRTGVSSWGDVGAASGSLLVNLAVQAGVRGYASGPLAMIWASSLGGLRSAVLLTR
jgi:3-oxoacyl-[acyl-carrier-protein] synthase-1